MDTSPTIPASPSSSAEAAEVATDPSAAAILKALGVALVLVFLTRLPVARAWPAESDEFGFLEQVRAHWFPMHHTLFLTLGKCLGFLAGNAYRAFIILDMIMSAVALVAAWWWLRALVSPATAVAGAAMLGCAPVFWGYGAMAGNYTAIVAVGSLLLGVAYRTRRQPAAWHPFAAAVALALGTGYRQDLGTFWLPVLVVILWHHRWKRAILAGGLFTAINLAWLLAMLNDVGGWTQYRAASAEFAHSAGYLNSVWNLGLVDAPVRYAVKLGMALLWTLGPCLIFVPRGISRVVRRDDGRYLALLLGLSALPAMGSHLLVHFGVPGYAFHYIPALLALAVVGIGVATSEESSLGRPRAVNFLRLPAIRLAAMAVLLGSVFLFYPTDYDRPGWRGSFDLAFARHTRIGLRTPMPDRQPANWRTANSRVVARAGAGIIESRIPDGTWQIPE
jgi:hypothetical protein